MKLLSLSASALLYYGCFAAAQNCAATAVSAIPSCAQNCILSGAPAIGCGGTDFACQCQQTAALFAAVDGCVAASCPSASYQAVIDGVSTVCDCAAPAVNVLAAGTASVSGTAIVSGTASVSWISGTVTASNTATGSVAPTTMTTTASSSGTVVTGGVGTTTSTTSGIQGNGAGWTGYSSVSSIATASVIGGAARPTPASGLLRHVVPVVIAGAAAIF